MPRPRKTPTWIWLARGGHREGFALRARRPFTLRGKPAAARLRITAYSAYELRVNGRYVAAGPTPSEYGRPLLDVFTEAELPLKRGRNVLAVLARNDHVGTPRHPRLPGGLWVDLEVTYKNGSTLRVVSDRRWKVRPAEDLSRRAPRLDWSAGFAEIRDTRREPDGWDTVGFTDRGWRAADEVTPELEEDSAPPAPRVWPGVRPVETRLRPERVQSAGRVAWRDGITAIPFGLAFPGRVCEEFYAATFVHSATARTVRLTFDCDENAALYVNNRHAVRQDYHQRYIDWLVPIERDDYIGLHRGQGARAGPVEVPLNAGWNALGVVLYNPKEAWGFALKVEDARTGRALKVAFSPDQRRGDLADWSIVTDALCPFMDGVIPETPAPNAGTFPDPAALAAWEKTAPSRRAVTGAASVLASARGKGPVTLKGGTYVRYDFGRPAVGTLELEARGPAGALLDLAWDDQLAPGNVLDPLRGGMRRADRLVLRGTWQRVRMTARRAPRYLHLVARAGEGAVEVRDLVLNESHVPVADPGGLEADDKALTDALTLCRNTVRCCLQRTYEGSPGREAEQSLPALWLLGRVERTLHGRPERAADALRAVAATQDETGALRPIVPAGLAGHVPDWSLLWVLALWEHVAWTGDRDLAADLAPAAEGVLRWTAAYKSPDGLLENAPEPQPWWLMLDLAPTDKRGEVTGWQALYVRATLAAAHLAEFLGDAAEAETHRTEAREVINLARNRLWDTKRKAFVDARRFHKRSKAASPQANAYAVLGHLVCWAEVETVADRFGPEADWGALQTPYGRTIALAALLEVGLADRALATVRAYWGRMADAGYATVPEVFAPDVADPEEPEPEGPYPAPPPRVACHGWGAAVEALLAEYLLGVRPGGPGFAPARLAPMPGRLTRLAGRVWTPHGKVAVRVEPAGGGRRIRYTLPKSLAYRLDRRYLDEADAVEIDGGREAEDGGAEA